MNEIIKIKEPKFEIAETDNIDLFCSLVQRGMERWIQAGQMLVSFKKDDPKIFAKITKRVPYLTGDILLAFTRIGEKKLYPYILLDASAGSKRLALLPYNQQEELYGKNVKLAYRKMGGSLDFTTRNISLLTRSEAELAISETGIRTVEEQMKILTDAAASTKSNGRVHAVAPTTPISESSTESPLDQVRRYTLDAQRNLMDARMALEKMDAPVCAGQYDLITDALSPIGKLRKALK